MPLRQAAERLVFQAAAIDLDAACSLPEHRDILVHDAARQPDEFVLGAPAELGELDPVGRFEIASQRQSQSRLRAPPTNSGRSPTGTVL